MDIRAKLAAGGRSTGVMIFEFFTPGLPQLMRLAGCEFIIYDMEHTGVSHDTLRRMTSDSNRIGRPYGVSSTPAPQPEAQS